MSRIEQNQEAALQRCPYLFNVTEEVGKVIDVVMGGKKDRITTLDNIREDHSAKYKPLSKYNLAYDRILRLLHNSVCLVSQLVTL